MLAGLRVLVLLGVSALPLGAQATLYVFAAPLTGAPSIGNGFANLAFNDATNSFNLYLTGVGLSSPITSAQFVSNPPITLPTLTTPNSTQQAGGFAFDSFYFNMAGSPALLQALQAGTVTISLATTNFPQGEISG